MEKGGLENIQTVESKINSEIPDVAWYPGLVRSGLFYPLCFLADVLTETLSVSGGNS